MAFEKTTIIIVSMLLVQCKQYNNIVLHIQNPKSNPFEWKFVFANFLCKFKLYLHNIQLKVSIQNYQWIILFDLNIQLNQIDWTYFTVHSKFFIFLFFYLLLFNLLIRFVNYKFNEFLTNIKINAHEIKRKWNIPFVSHIVTVIAIIL